MNISIHTFSLNSSICFFFSSSAWTCFDSIFSMTSAENFSSSFPFFSLAREIFSSWLASFLAFSCSRFFFLSSASASFLEMDSSLLGAVGDVGGDRRDLGLTNKIYESKARHYANWANRSKPLFRVTDSDQAGSRIYHRYMQD